MPTVQTFGYFNIRDVTHQCARCRHILIEKGLACCEQDRPGFPRAQRCEKFSEEPTDGDV